MPEAAARGEKPRNLCLDCTTRYDSCLYCAVCLKLYQEDPQAGVDPADRTAVPIQRFDDQERMIECNHCFRWVHAECDGIDARQYQTISNCTHPIWANEYLCPHCRVEQCKAFIQKLSQIDTEMVFWEPVNTETVKNYYDIVKVLNFCEANFCSSTQLR